MENADGHWSLGFGIAGGPFRSPCDDPFGAVAPFPYPKVNRIYFHRGRAIASVLPSNCCDAALAARPAYAHTSERLSTPASIGLASRTGNPNTRRFRHAPPVSIPFVHRCTVPASIGRFDHHPRVRRERDYRPAQPREARLAMPPGFRAAGTPFRVARASNREQTAAPNHAPVALCFSPLIMERWIV